MKYLNQSWKQWSLYLIKSSLKKDCKSESALNYSIVICNKFVDFKNCLSICSSKIFKSLIQVFIIILNGSSLNIYYCCFFSNKALQMKHCICWTSSIFSTWNSSSIMHFFRDYFECWSFQKIRTSNIYISYSSIDNTF